MQKVNLLNTDLRGRVVFPEPFRSESIFEYVVKGDQITLYPVRTVRKYPDMSDLQEEDLPEAWMKQEESLNRDKQLGIFAKNSQKALRRVKKKA